MLLMVDAAKRCVINVEPGKDAGTLRDFMNQLEVKSGSRENIADITSDMSKAFMREAARSFPNAKLTIDKFHVKQKLTEALNAVRKEEQRETAEKKRLFQSCRLFLIPEKNLTKEQAARSGRCPNDTPKPDGRTASSARLTISTTAVHWRKKRKAEQKFDSLYSWMRRCRLQPMKDAPKCCVPAKPISSTTSKADSPMPSVRASTPMVQATKRKARGFATFEGFRAMIFLVAGKLDLAVRSSF